MSYETDWFRAGTAGKTVDGRNIEEQWLDDSAELYDPVNEYKAQVWAWSHWNKYERYGEVSAVKVSKDGKGRKALFVKIRPLPALVEMNRAGQLEHSSMEITPDYKGEGKAYLTGLVMTNNPASIGTEAAHFSAQPADAKPLVSQPEKFTADLSNPADSIMPNWFKPFAKLFTGKAGQPEADQPTEEDVIMTPEQFTKFEQLMTAQTDAINGMKDKLESYTAKPAEQPAKPETKTEPEQPAKIPTKEEFETMIDAAVSKKKASAEGGDKENTLPSRSDFQSMIDKAVEKFMTEADGQETKVPKNDGSASDDWQSDV